ncbi:uncharacterized isoform X1 [Oryza sativa Japonica Group]|uniref:uncharacterized LOC4343647 isoform 2 n=1 Tax=Oryza sativa subsp. japonica TaxID=39947 RepID=UPI001F5F984C|nr:uncharacterized LOC4343647 isoform 2 [Oryza sativa Japonica Group]
MQVCNVYRGLTHDLDKCFIASVCSSTTCHIVIYEEPKDNSNSSVGMKPSKSGRQSFETQPLHGPRYDNWAGIKR